MTHIFLLRSGSRECICDHFQRHGQLEQDPDIGGEWSSVGEARVVASESPVCRLFAFGHRLEFVLAKVASRLSHPW